MSVQQRKNIGETAKKVIAEEYGEVTKLGQQAVRSGAWLYPLRGIVYFATHPSLYTAVTPVLLKLLTTSLVVLAVMFFATYLPQVAFLALFTGPLAFIAAVPLVLTESSVIILFVARVFLLSQVQDQLFDAVLLQQGHDQLVGKGRQVLTSSQKGTSVKKLGKAVVQPLNRFSTEGLIRYIISVPLNFVPVVGTIIFLLFNGVKAGPSFMSRYFGLKQMSKIEQDKFIHERHGSFTAFGATALALQLIPVVGLAFIFTSSCGAALWASDLERKGANKPFNSATVQSESRVEL